MLVSVHNLSAVHRNEAGESKRLLILDAAQEWSVQEEVRLAVKLIVTNSIYQKVL